MAIATRMSGGIFKFRGAESMLAGIQNLKKEKKRDIELAFESVLREIANYAKLTANFKDHTGNLRNSIGVGPSERNIRVVKAATKFVKRSTPTQFERPFSWNGDKIRGVVFAGMEYAIYVEFRPGLTVITGAFAAYHEKWIKLVAQRMKEYSR